MFAFGAAFLARLLFDHLPEIFLPLYRSLSPQYLDLSANPNLRRLINDNRNAIMHLGFYLGCLSFETARRDWRNVVLISTVGLINGTGWALLQNWKWAKIFWPGADFNFWRCWESCAGISMGLAYGVAYFLINERLAEEERAPHRFEVNKLNPNLQRFGAYLGLLLGLGLSIRSGLKGWANIYLGNENYWNNLLWKIVGPLLVVGLVALLARVRLRPVPHGFQGDIFPHAYPLIWGVLIIQNLLAQLVTGPWSAWNEVAFSLYYVLLFAISALIVHHFHRLKLSRLGSERAAVLATA
jgi:hypothetical protein